MTSNFFRSGFFKNYKWTVILGGIAIFKMSLAFALDLDVFEKLVGVLLAFQDVVEPYEGDEIIPALLLVMAGYFGDMMRQRRQARHARDIADQRLAAMREILGSVQDVVNNSLNNMQLFRFEAEQAGALDQQQLAQFDDVIRQTAIKLKEIVDANEGQAQSNAMEH